MLTLGSWCAELRTYGPNDILSRYFRPCLDLLEKWPHDDGPSHSARTETYLRVARFCDDQFKHLSERVGSKEHEESRKIREKLDRDAKEM